MSRIEDILRARVGIDKKYQFTIEAAGTGQVLTYAPDGFFNGKTKYIRNKTYRGLFRSIAVNVLTFYKDGRELIKNYYDTFGVDYEVNLKVEKFSSSGFVPFVTLKLDLASYSEDDVSVKVQAIDSTFIEKIKNREDVEVNLFSLISVDGDTITDFPGKLNLIDTSINNNSAFTDGTVYDPPNAHIVPLVLTSGGDFSEAQSPIQDINSVAGCFFDSSLSPRKLTISGNISGNIVMKSGSGGFEVGYQASIYVFDKNFQTSQVIVLNSSVGTDSLSFSYTINHVITINKDDVIMLRGDWYTYGTITDYRLDYTLSNLAINETYIGLPAKTINSFGVYEAFIRTLQLITGSDDVLRSNYFGRTDTPFYTYSSDGVILNLTKGRFLRDNSSLPFPITFKTLFQSVNSIYNIGMAIENGQVRIENISYFYSNVVVLDVSDRITDEILTKNVSPDKIFKQIQVGFEKFGTDKSETIDDSWLEFNTKATYSTEIKSVTTSLVILSKIRADGTAIVRLANDTDLSKEASGDNDLFFLKSVRDGTEFKIATNEGYTLIKGSTYANKSLNLDLSPARSLLRWGNIIRSGLKSGTIRWQNTDNNYQLSTQKTDEAIVTEDSDIDYTTLGAALFQSENFKFTIPLSDSEINLIFGNPYGLIKISDTESGWIESMEINNSDNMTTFILTRK